MARPAGSENKTDAFFGQQMALCIEIEEIADDLKEIGDHPEIIMGLIEIEKKARKMRHRLILFKLGQKPTTDIGRLLLTKQTRQL